LDNIISDNVRTAKGVNKSLLSSYSLILEHLLYGLHKNKFNPFIYESFKVFCQNKTEITLNIHYIWKCIRNRAFLNVIFGSNVFVIGDLSEDDDNNFSIPVNNENLPMRKFLESFNNVTSIKITNVQYDDYYYSFCLIRLLSLIEDTKIEKIEISSGYGYKGWLSSSWKVSSSSLIQTYKKKGFQIEYKYNKIYINKNK